MSMKGLNRLALLLAGALVFGGSGAGLVMRLATPEKAAGATRLDLPPRPIPSPAFARIGAIAAGPATVHYAPAENLEKLDVEMLDTAAHEIDLAAFVLTDFPVIEALERAARRGVAVRILLDRGQHSERPEVPPMDDLRKAPNVAIRIKTSRVYMHLKSYQIDGRMLRTGSANFSASGLKQQDNDLVLVESAGAAGRFKHGFDAMFGAGAAE